MPVPYNPTQAERNYWQNVWWNGESRRAQYYCCCVGRDGYVDSAEGQAKGCVDSRALYSPSWEQYLVGQATYSHGHDGKHYTYWAWNVPALWDDFNRDYCLGTTSPSIINFPSIPTKQTIDLPFILNITSTVPESTRPISIVSSNSEIATVFDQQVILGGKAGNVTLTATQTNSCYPPSVASQTFTVYGIIDLPTASKLEWGQTLGNSIIAGGSANLPGTFSWANPDIITNVGVYNYVVKFTPDDANWGPFTAKIPVKTTNVMITSLTNADKINKIIANGESGPYTPSPSSAISNLNPDSLKGILHLSNKQYRNLTSVDIKYLGIKDVYFLGRKLYKDNIFTGVVPSGLKFLDLTSNALTTNAIDGILVSMNENAKANKLSLGQIYLWGGSSGWNQFPSEEGYQARQELISPVSPKYSGVFTLIGSTGTPSGVSFIINGKLNNLLLTGTTIIGNIFSIINKSPPFEDFQSTYTVQYITGSGNAASCLFTRNLDGKIEDDTDAFGFSMSGVQLPNPPLTGSFLTLGKGGKYYGNWRVGVNRWLEISETINNVSLIQPSRNLVRTNSAKQVQAYNILDNRSQYRYISRLKSGQTINIGLINYGTRGISNISYDSELVIADANFLNQPPGPYPPGFLNFPILGRAKLGSTSALAGAFRDGTLGQTAYGHGGAYTSSNEFYRYSGCPSHSVECFADTAFGGPNLSSLLSPYPFDGNTVDCPITCYTNQYDFDVLIFLDGPAPFFLPRTVFVDDNLAYNVINYPPGLSCSYGNNLDPDMGKVCSERSIPRDHARII